MKLKKKLPSVWESNAVWPMCGKCGWRDPLGACEQFPCEDCAKKYNLTDLYYEQEPEAGK